MKSLPEKAAAVSLLLTDALLTLLPFFLLPLNYDRLPASMPVFVDLAGRAVLSADKTMALALRLPLMTLTLQMVCLVMYLSMKRNIRGESGSLTGLNAWFWLAASFTAALKLGFSTLEMLAAGQAAVIFRIVVVASAGAGVIAMAAAAWIFCVRAGSGLSAILAPGKKSDTVLLATLLVIYAFLAVFPMIR